MSIANVGGVRARGTRFPRKDMKNRIDGSANQAKGTIKEAVGGATGDTKLKAEGKIDKATGKVQNAIGGLKDAARGI